MHVVKVNIDGALSWVEVPDPVPGAGEAVVDVHAAAVNRADLLQRAGKYPPPPGAPPWLGLEVAGVIADAGDEPASGGARRWRKGDRVCALLAGGGYAEKVAVSRDLLLPVPRGLTLEEAASLPEVFSTAYLNLVMEAGLAKGETVVIQAGASGVGIAAIQLAKSLGARVLTTVSTAEKSDAVRALGADIVIDRNTEDLGEAMDRCAAEGAPVDVVLDCVGGPQLGANLARLAPGGRWILIATLGGTQAEINLRSLLNSGARLIGSKLRSRPVAEKARIIRELTERVWPQIEEGSIRPVIHRVLPIAQAEKAHAVLECRENTGKVVLRIAP